MGCGTISRRPKPGLVVPFIQIVPDQESGSQVRLNRASNCSALSAESGPAGPSPFLLLKERVGGHEEAFASGAHDVCILGTTRGTRGPAVAAQVEASFEEKGLETSGFLEAAQHLSLKAQLAEIGIGVVCCHGRKSSPNQDNVLVCRAGDITVCGIADGHGTHGHWVSHWIARYALSLLLSEPLSERQLPTQDFLIRAFNFMHEALVLRAEEDGFDVTLSGSTLSLCCIDHQVQRLVAAWVGDSTCMRAWRSGSDFTVQALTDDHTPKQQDERQRIHSVGGVINSYGGQHRVSWAGSSGMASQAGSAAEASAAADRPAHRGGGGGGNLLQVEGPQGLAITRALGDLEMHKLGVIHKPGYNRQRCDAEDTFVVCSSDGVWEYVTFEEAAALVRAAGRDHADEAARRIMDTARDKWIEECAEDDDTDDISAIVVWL